MRVLPCLLLSAALTFPAASAAEQPAGAPVTATVAPAAVSAPPFVAADAARVIEATAAALEENFVFPEVGARYAATLRSKRNAGGYARFADATAFAKAVTADLQAVHSDRHLKLIPPQAGAASAAVAPPPRAIMQRNGVTRSGWIAPGVAYIAFAATTVGWGLWAYLMRAYSASTVAPFSLLVPVSGSASRRCCSASRSGFEP